MTPPFMHTLCFDHIHPDYLWPLPLLLVTFPSSTLPLSWFCVGLVKLDYSCLQKAAKLTSGHTTEEMLSLSQERGQGLVSPLPLSEC